MTASWTRMYIFVAMHNKSRGNARNLKIVLFAGNDRPMTTGTREWDWVSVYSTHRDTHGVVVRQTVSILQRNLTQVIQTSCEISQAAR